MRVVSVVLFALGVVFLFMHTTLPFLWSLLGISATYPLNTGAILYYASGLTPILGAVLAAIGAETAAGKRDRA